MGMNKALARMNDGRSFLHHIVTCAAQAGIDTVYVVIGSQAAQVREAHPLDVHWVLNTQWHTNSMMDSLRLALRQIPRGCAAIHWPVDCIGIQPAALRELRAQAADRCALLSHLGQWGHPVWLGPRAVQELVVRPQAYPTLRHYLLLNAACVQRIPSGSAALANCNTAPAS